MYLSFKFLVNIFKLKFFFKHFPLISLLFWYIVSLSCGIFESLASVFSLEIFCCWVLVLCYFVLWFRLIIISSPGLFRVFLL